MTKTQGTPSKVKHSKSAKNDAPAATTKVATTLNQADQVKLARALVNNDKNVRKQTCNALATTLATTQFTDPEMMKLGKALHYCLWMTDKVDMQLELSSFLTSTLMISSLSTTATRSQYLKVFYQTLLREWPLLDQHRLDKFYKALTLMVRTTFQLFQQQEYEEESVQVMTQLLSEEILAKTPNGLRYHVLDILLSELYLSNSEIGTLPFVRIVLLPMLELLLSTSNTADPIVRKRILDKVLLTFLSKYAPENAYRQVTGEDETEAQQQQEQPKTLFVNVNTRALQQYIFAVASKPFNPNEGKGDNSNETPISVTIDGVEVPVSVVVDDRFRKTLYDLHRSFASVTGVAFVNNDNVNANNNNKNNNANNAAAGKKRKNNTTTTAAPVAEPVKATTTMTTEVAAVKKSKTVAAEPEQTTTATTTATTKESKTPKKKATEAPVVPEAAVVVAEKEQETKSTKKAKKADAPTTTTTPAKAATTTAAVETPVTATTTTEEFVASKKFTGAKAGYVFKLGKRGQGYYIDHRQQQQQQQRKTASPSPQQQKQQQQQKDKRAATPSRSIVVDNNDDDDDDDSDDNNNGATKSAKKRVSFGKRQSKAYTESVNALKASAPVEIMKVHSPPRSAIKPTTFNNNNSSSSNGSKSAVKSAVKKNRL